MNRYLRPQGLRRYFSAGQFFSFLDGYAYIFIYAALVFVSSLCGQEPLVFGLTALLVVLVCLFAKDTRALVPPIILVIYAVSWMHTPQGASDFFNAPAAFVSFGILGAIAVAALAFRIAAFPPKGESRLPGLRTGLVVLCAAFLLNGALSADFVLSDIVFGALIAFSFIAAYLLIRRTCAYRKDNGLYFAASCFAAGLVIFLQVAYALLFRDVWEGENGALCSGIDLLRGFFAGGALPQGLSISKDAMIAGWGMSNNFGGMLAMFIPASLYLAYKVKNGWLFYLFAFAQLGAVACTLSRTALLTGGVLLVGGAVILSVARSPRRTFVRACNAAVVLAVLAAGILFFDRIREIFAVIFDRGFDDSNRFKIWKYGLDKFFSSPLFGAGFEQRFYLDFVGFDIENWVFPDMFHNVFVQILASCGLVGMAAYLYHLAQVLCLLLRRPSADRLLYLGIFLAVSGASLLDNHIFHIFPALLYSLSLGFWETDAAAAARLPLYGREARRFVPFAPKTLPQR